MADIIDFAAFAARRMAKKVLQLEPPQNSYAGALRDQQKRSTTSDERPVSDVVAPLNRTPDPR